MKKRKIETYDIVSSFNTVKEFRSVVLVGHLNLEFMVNDIILQFFMGMRTSESQLTTVNALQFEEFILDNLNFRKKIEILLKLEFIDKGLHKGLCEFNDKRNKAAHDLKYELTDVDCNIQKRKAIKYYNKLSETRYKHFKEMKIYEWKELPSKE